MPHRLLMRRKRTRTLRKRRNESNEAEADAVDVTLVMEEGMHGYVYVFCTNIMGIAIRAWNKVQRSTCEEMRDK